jgi:ABC-type glycerol-3-phosphate transport system substrate-binding protein
MQQLPRYEDRHLMPFHKYLRICSLLLAFSLFGGLLSACGGPSGPTQVTTINVMVSGQPIGGQSWWKTVVKHFEAANPTIKVKLNYQPDLAAANAFAKTAVQTGTALDVAAIQESTTTAMVAKNALAPLDNYLNADKTFDIKTLPAAMVQEVTKDGHIYGIPFYNAPVLRQYNKELFAKAGVEPPKTYQDLLPVCQALQKVGVARPLYQDVGGYPAMGWWAAWGAFPLSDDSQQATIYPKMKEWATFYHDLIWKHKCIDPGHDEAGKGTNPNISFANGKLAWRDFSSIALPAMTPEQRASSGFALPEAGPSGQVVNFGGSHLVIPANSKNKDAAWKFISFEMTSKQDQKAIALELHDLPSMPSLVTDPDIVKQAPYLVPFLQSLTGKSIAAPNVAWYYEISYGPLYNQLLKLFRDPNPAHIEGYLKDAQKQSEDLIAKDKQLA